MSVKLEDLPHVMFGVANASGVLDDTFHLTEADAWERAKGWDSCPYNDSPHFVVEYAPVRIITAPDGEEEPEHV